MAFATAYPIACSAQPAPDVNIFVAGVGIQKCAVWTLSSKLLDDAVASWVGGYVSAMNQQSSISHTVGSKQGLATIVVKVRATCGANPDATIATAAFQTYVAMTTDEVISPGQ